MWQCSRSLSVTASEHVRPGASQSIPTQVGRGRVQSCVTHSCPMFMWKILQNLFLQQDTVKTQYCTESLYIHNLSVQFLGSHLRVFQWKFDIIQEPQTCAAWGIRYQQDVLDSSTDQDGTDRISGHFFLFYHDQRVWKVRKTCVFDVLYRCLFSSAFS